MNYVKGNFASEWCKIDLTYILWGYTLIWYAGKKDNTCTEEKK